MSPKKTIVVESIALPSIYTYVYSLPPLVHVMVMFIVDIYLFGICTYVHWSSAMWRNGWKPDRVFSQLKKIQHACFAKIDMRRQNEIANVVVMNKYLCTTTYAKYLNVYISLPIQATPLNLTSRFWKINAVSILH